MVSVEEVSNKQLVSVRCETSTNKHLVPDSFKATGEAISYIPKYKVIGNSTQEFGWYKRPGFDAAYIAMKAMIPDLSIWDFSCMNCFEAKPNKALVECRAYKGEEGLVESVGGSIRYDIDGYVSHIRSLSSDLESNMEHIKAMIQEMSSA